MNKPVLAFLIAMAPAYPLSYHVRPADDLQAAVRALSAGDTLFLGGGVYARDTSLYILGIKGTADSPVVILNEPGETPHLNWDTIFTVFVYIDSGGYAMNVVTLGGCSYLEIAGLEISGGRSGIETCFGGNDHIVIRDCHIHDVGNVGIRIAKDRQTRFRCVHNHIHHTGIHGEGYYIGDSPGAIAPEGNPAFCEFIANWIHHTASIVDPQNQGDGIELKVGCRSNVIRFNVVHDTKYPGCTVWGTNGGTIAENNLVYSNFFFNTTQDACIQAGAEADVFNNVCLNPGQRRVFSYDQNLSTGSPMRNLRVFNNTLIGARVLFNRMAADSNFFFNNAVYCRSSDTAVLFNPRPAGDTLFPVFSHNRVLGRIISGAVLPAVCFTASTQGFSAFEDSAQWNYYPAANSELRDAGVDMSTVITLPAAALRDFNGTLRGAAWDVGAYEFDPAHPTNLGWTVDSLGGFMDTVLIPGPEIEAFFRSFDQGREISLSASPNPAAAFSRIAIRGLTAAGLFNPARAVFLGLYDVSGKLVRDLTPRLFSTGRMEVLLDSRGLPAGAYALRFRCGGEMKSLKLAVVR